MEDEYDEVFKSEEEKEKPQKKEDMETTYNTIQEIINERNKFYDEKNIRVPEHRERIGRLNLNLFGDPDNAEWESKIDVLNAELDHPMTKTHPIAHKTREVVREIKELQLEYTTLQKFYDKFVKEIGELLDNSIKIYLKNVESRRTILGQFEKEKEMREADKNISEYMVNKFMEREGYVVLERYKKGIENKDRMEIMSSKGLFIRKAKDFFIGKHPDPKRVGQLIFEKFTKVTSSSDLGDLDEEEQKNIPPEEGSQSKEPFLTRPKSLKENENHNSKENDEAEDISND